MAKYNFGDDEEDIFGALPPDSFNVSNTAPPAPIQAPLPLHRSPMPSASAPSPMPTQKSPGAPFPENKPAPIPEPILAKLEVEKPDLVAKYRAKMALADQGVKDAEGNQDLGNMGNVIAKLATDFGNSQKDDTIYHNSWSKMGSAPQIEKAERKEYDGSMVDKIGAQGVARAKEEKDGVYKDFAQEDNIAQLSQSANGRDPNSDTSKQATLILKSALASRAAEAERAGDKEAAASLREQAKGISGLSAVDAMSAVSNIKSAGDYKDVIKSIDENKKIDAASADRKLTAQMHADGQRNIAEQRKIDAGSKTNEKMEALRVGDLGYAQTADDAKQLKAATESKAQFDSQLDELIALRTKHGGGATFNREDVGRANQLSKDLLLKYKDMAKLGVLSQSDEAILNKIIPSDPLEYNSPLAAVQGQDPILQNMKKFKGDAEKDYQTKLNNRLRKEGRSESVGKPESASTGVTQDDFAAERKRRGL